MATAVHLDEKQFQDTLALSGVVVVDFWATWCMPCKMMAPVMDKLAADYAGRAVVAKVDVDEEPELAAQYRVQSIPMVVFFKKGQAVSTLIGVRPYETLAAELDKLLK